MEAFRDAHCEIILLDSNSSDDLDSLYNVLEEGLGGSADVEKSARKGPSDTMGPLEVIAVTFAGGSFLLSVLKWILEWQHQKQQETEKTPSVCVETEAYTIEIRPK